MWGVTLSLECVEVVDAMEIEGTRFYDDDLFAPSRLHKDAVAGEQ